MSYTILYEKPALKFIQKQPKEQQRRILEAVHALPDSGDIKQLKGHTGLLRLRVGSYRIIYTVDNGRLIVRIIDAGNRAPPALFFYKRKEPLSCFQPRGSLLCCLSKRKVGVSIMECLANPVASPLFYCKSNMILLQPRIFSEEVCTHGKQKRFRWPLPLPCLHRQR